MSILFYLTITVLFIYGLLIRYYHKAWNAIPTSDVNSTESLPKISVIIPARNEEKNILTCLQSLAQQVYPAELLEVIVVNDHSTDKTEAIVRASNINGVKLINLEDHIGPGKIFAYKKKSIETAIANATGDLIVTTDADCTAGREWIREMANCYLQRSAVFIAAPVKMKPQKTLLSIFQSLDFLTLQGITGASVANGFHNMCNGANLAYERKAFYEVEGFKNIDGIASGDDMLLMQKISARYPGKLFFLKSQQAIVETHTEPDWNSFLQQRIRWASKSGSYREKNIIIVLLLVYLLNVLLLIFFIAGFVDLVWMLIFFIFLILKTILEIRFTVSVAKFFNLGKLLVYFPFLQPLHVFYTVLAGFLGMFKTYTWKGRKLK